MPLDSPISTHTERLQVLLTEEEFTKRAKRVAQLHGDLQQHVSQTKSAEAVAAARKKEIEAVISQLAEQMRSGEEQRDVTVNVFLDAGEALEVRADTEEVLRRRPIRPDEKQGALFDDLNKAPDTEGEEEKEDDGEPT